MTWNNVLTMPIAILLEEAPRLKSRAFWDLMVMPLYYLTLTPSTLLYGLRSAPSPHIHNLLPPLRRSPHLFDSKVLDLHTVSPNTHACFVIASIYTISFISIHQQGVFSKALGYGNCVYICSFRLGITRFTSISSSPWDDDDDDASGYLLLMPRLSRSPSFEDH